MYVCNFPFRYLYIEVFLNFGLRKIYNNWDR